MNIQMQDLWAWVVLNKYWLLGAAIVIMSFLIWFRRRRAAEAGPPTDIEGAAGERESPSIAYVILLFGLVWGLIILLGSEFVLQPRWSQYLINALFGVMAAMLLRTFQIQAKVTALDSKLEASRVNPETLQSLHSAVDRIDETLSSQNEKLRELAQRDQQLMEFLGSLTISLKTVDDRKSAAIEADSYPLIHITQKFVDNFFADRFSLELQNKAAILKGHHPSLDAYRALWDFLVNKQEERGPDKPIVVRALHAAPLDFWDFDTETEKGRRSLELLSIQQSFIDAGGKFCRIIVNRRNVSHKIFKEQCRPIIDHMYQSGIHLAYIYHTNNRKKYKLQNFPQSGFIWVPDYQYGQAWTVDSRKDPLITETSMTWDEGAEKKFPVKWEKWKEHVLELKRADDNRLVMPKGVKII